MNALLTGTAAAAGLAAVGALHVSQLPPPPPTYAITVTEAEERLRAMTLRGLLIGRSFTLTAGVESGVRTLRWDFAGDGAKAGSCRVGLLTAEDKRTTALVDCSAPPDARRPDLAPLGARLLTLVMTENAHAALAGREFDHAAMGRALLDFSVRNRAAFARLKEG